MGGGGGGGCEMRWVGEVGDLCCCGFGRGCGRGLEGAAIRYDRPAGLERGGNTTTGRGRGKQNTRRTEERERGTRVELNRTGQNRNRNRNRNRTGQEQDRNRNRNRTGIGTGQKQKHAQKQKQKQRTQDPGNVANSRVNGGFESAGWGAATVVLLAYVWLRRSTCRGAPQPSKMPEETSIKPW